MWTDTRGIREKGERIIPRSSLVIIALLLFFIAGISSVQAALPLQVTVTATPSTLRPGGAEAQIMVLVMNGGQPVDGADVTLRTDSELAIVNPASGTTDSSGMIFSTFSTLSNGGSIRVTATARKVDMRLVYEGQGYVDVPIQPEEVPPVPPPPPLPVTHQLPVAVISIDRYAGEVPFTVMFDGRGSIDPDGIITQYDWDFGDGESGTGYVMYHTYSNQGTYHVALRVVDNEGMISSADMVITAIPTEGPTPLACADGFTCMSQPEAEGFFGPGNYQTGTDTSGTGCGMDATGNVQHCYRAILFNVMPSPTMAPRTTIPYPTPIPTMALFNQMPSPAAIPLPLLGGLLPSPILYLLAVLAGTGIAALSAVPATRGISRRLEQAEKSAKDYLSSTASSLINRFEVSRRKLGPVSQGDPVLLGLTLKELAVFLLCAGAYAVAFLLRDRLQISPLNLLILVGAGALTTLVHQLAHHEAAQRAGKTAELQFWGLGTAMMVLSSWLFGFLFASPSRNLYQKEQEPSRRTIAMISLAGPAMSLALAIVSLLLVPMGGIITLAGRTSFSMNLLTAVYSMVPFDPMDGKPVYDWNHAIWAAIFLPLLVVYTAVYLL